MENTLELKEIHLTPFQQSFTILLAANLRIVELSQIVLEYERAEEIRNIASLIAQKSILLDLIFQKMAKLFELSRKRLQSLFNDKSLKRNAIETIIASFNSWTSLNEQNGLAGRLSPALRDVLLQEVLRRIKCPEKFKKLARVIPFLLSSVTMTLDLKVLYLQMSYDYVGLYYIDEVLYMAAQLAPNIQRLVFKNRGIVQDQYNAANYALFSLLANNYRCLQILEVQDFSADLHDLLFLCGHSPSLRVLKLNSVLYVFTPTGEEISMQLCNLRLLVVENVSSQSIQIIRQHVPNIDIVFDLKHTGLSYDDFLYPIGNPNLSQRKIFTFDQSWFDHPDTEIHERHPNIIHLQVVGEDAFDVGEANLFLPNFTKISSLSIETANQEIKIFLMQLAKIFLHQYGQNLRSFSLQLGDPEDPNDDVAFNIEHLFNSCPNIESLSLEESNGFVGPHFEVFAPLKKISWIGYYENWS
ncbi:Hypothetical predicted protein [Cloeon dipterum]|uniref:F-box domain-containing protein n=1 Tax=Cloeon dipterum TaxID=197152 RepID=A0A8S1E4R7_9INSE|nr:Hypothetical predicted protein [Cloeon dipterum]